MHGFEMTPTYLKINESAPLVTGIPIDVLDDVIFKKVGRNDPCPCSSGKKYKKCCARFS